jgi:hypothetical protein
MKKLVAVINDESQVEYDRTRPLGDKQKEYLDVMDRKMDEGIPHGPGNIFAPDLNQKTQFVASQLVDAIKAGNEQLAAATLAYLANKLPDLQQVVAEESADGCTTIKFIFDKAFVKSQPIQFMKTPKLNV